MKFDVILCGKELFFGFYESNYELLNYWKCDWEWYKRYVVMFICDEVMNGWNDRFIGYFF